MADTRSPELTEVARAIATTPGIICMDGTALANAARAAIQALSSKNELPSRVAMFLEILSAAGGAADASDNPWNWINAFCEGHEGRDPDTFNQAIDLGFVSWSHDSDSDNSTITLTEMGRAALNPKDTGQ
jgi:hypothetical protein